MGRSHDKGRLPGYGVSACPGRRLDAAFAAQRQQNTQGECFVLLEPFLAETLVMSLRRGDDDAAASDDLRR